MTSSDIISNRCFRRTRPVAAMLVRAWNRYYSLSPQHSAYIRRSVTITNKKNRQNTTEGRPPNHVYQRNRQNKTHLSNLRIEGNHRRIDALKVYINWNKDLNVTAIYQSSKRRRFMPKGRQKRRIQQNKSFNKRRQRIDKARTNRQTRSKIGTKCNDATHTVPITLSVFSWSPWKARHIRLHAQGLLLAEFCTGVCSKMWATVVVLQ